MMMALTRTSSVLLEGGHMAGAPEPFAPTMTSHHDDVPPPKAASRMSETAGWLGETADQARYANVSATILTSLRDKVYNKTTGAFADGLGISHSAMHATMFPAMAGAVDDAAVPGMGMMVLGALKAKFDPGKGMRCSCMGAYWLLQGLYAPSQFSDNIHLFLVMIVCFDIV